ncbi:MAG: DUF177 domain-containing protein [Burkholderiales bacterium]|nr:DUF177 domain-containing protein [Burkholderiales bacterium]
MRDRPPDPRRLDIRRFAAAGAQLAGRAGADELPRLVADAPLAGDEGVEWSMRGEQRSGAAGAPELWLHLQARARVVLPCQRCLRPMTLPLQAARAIRFVEGETEAERLDEELEDDVLALPARGGIDALALVEDELIFALPLVPCHEACPEPLRAPSGAASVPEGDAAAHPFAPLAALKRGGGSDR